MIYAIFFVYSFGVTQASQGDIFASLSECRSRAEQYNSFAVSKYGPKIDPIAKCFGKPGWSPVN